MEEKILKRIRRLMAKQSGEARREVELTNVPVVVAQAERFRQRLGYWEARVHELNGAGPPKRGSGGHHMGQVPRQLFRSHRPSTSHRGDRHS